MGAEWTPDFSKVPWSALRTKSGTAENVPVALAALASARHGAALSDAYWQLDNHVVCQGTVYESAYAAVPFLLDLLATSDCRDVRAAAYDVLIEVAAGSSDPERPNVTLPSGDELDVSEACRESIRARRLIYAADLEGMDHGLRVRALDLLHAMKGDRVELATLLRRIVPKDDELRTHFERVLAELATPTSPTRFAGPS